MLFEIIVASSVLVLVWFLARKDPETLLGIYSQPGKWYFVKKYLFMLMLIIRKRQLRNKQASDGLSRGYGHKSHSSIDDMERPQLLSSDEMAIDCMYFNGLDAAGTFVVLRIARRNGRKAEIWLSINVPGIGFFQSPLHPDTSVYNVDSDSYSAGGLKFECIEPMKRWRITFNGLLRKGMSSEWSPDQVETVHAQLSLMWCAFTDVFDFDTDVHPSCLAEAVAREKWSRDYFDRLKKSHQTHYEQWGELWGTFRVEGHPEKLLRVRGYRDHSYGVRDWYSFHRYAINFAYLEDGSVFHVNTLSMPNTLSLLQCGYMSMPNAIMHPVSWTDMNMSDLGEDRNPPEKYKFNFIAGGKKYHVQVASHTVFQYNHHEDWRSVIFEQVSTFEVNGVKGYGIFEYCYRRPRESPVVLPEVFPLLKELTVSEHSESALALTFAQPACTSSRLVGGKGCQLAMLTQLQTEKFYVPTGFCLTVRAFETQLQSNENLQKLVTELHELSCKNPDKLLSSCATVVTAFQSSALCTEVQDTVAKHLELVFGDKYSSVSLAVRSSATGEDGTEMSAAGQMDTVLGVCGLEQVLAAICKCWGSQFAFPAVSYRRQHGQSIKLSAGVVIQQMVPAATAGVLFTCHPVTGNPGHMILNANYGLGESVVSGESEPDEITISRSWNDKLTIASKKVGAKKIQIRLAADGFTQEMKGDERDAQICCLSDDIILRLAAIGVELEKRFANPRDIEFAVDSSGVIHLLQARPITSLDVMSEYELMHEFDTALCTDRELLTTANIQEMMPAAMTPLTLCTFFHAVDWCGQKLNFDVGSQSCIHLVSKYLQCSSNQGFIDLSSASGICDLHSSIGDFRMMQLALLGEIRTDFTLNDVKSYNGSLPLPKRLLNAVKFFIRLRSSDTLTNHWTEYLETDFINCKETSMSKLYDNITRTLPLINEIFDYHYIQSAKSAVWSNVMMVILAKNKPDWKPEYFSDLAMLLAKCDDVYSADVPAALKQLADVILETDGKEKFIELAPADAVKWLQSSESGRAGAVFAEFLKRHGHRCIREAELREKSWQTEPVKLIKVIQILVKTPQQTTMREIVSLGKLIERIKTPTTYVSRAILQRILPRAQKAVGSREFSKSLSIKMMEKFKAAYCRLADLMVNESRLPDNDLIYFLTHREIGHVLKTRSGSLIARAQKRRLLLPKLMSLRFPRVFFSRPIAIESAVVDNDNVNLTSEVSLTGCPVSQGEVCGIARVVTSIEAASEIQIGDILIVPYTDVGWSPYFPMIAGLVTEIGGLLSHGAVVAREYGLPCVVNIPRATVLFKTGDRVRLNGSAGTIEKLTVAAKVTH